MGPLRNLVAPPLGQDPLRERTTAVMMRWHQAWASGDVAQLMALLDPAVVYDDHFQNRRLGHDALESYLAASMPVARDQGQIYLDRLRVDGECAFLQYRVWLRPGAQGLSLEVCEAYRVQDDRIVAVREIACLCGDEQRDAVQPKAGSRDAVSHLGLSPRQLGIMGADLSDYFQKGQPWRDPGLDLAQVAQATGYSRNQVSFYLNQVEGQSFYRYINRLRIAHLRSALSSATSVKIEDLARESGFRSMSTFYRCFRDETGEAPGSYLARLSQRTR